jgi:cyclohexanecarboxylate-CoA ligase
VFWAGLLEQGRSRQGALKTVQVARTFGTTVPAPLVSEVFELLGVPLSGAWGMTEAGGTMMLPDDPVDWAVRSVGRIMPGSEVELRSEHEITEEQPGRVFIRGATVCLATVGRDTGELIVLADHDNGWYDTGDLAVWDGRGGFRIMGRAADRIGGVFMIPVADVESALLGHPAVADVALVGYPDGDGGELAAAMVVSREPDLTLADLRDHLAGLGMTEWYWPSRLELVDELPRNAMGKVRKAVLAQRLVAEPVGGE